MNKVSEILPLPFARRMKSLLADDYENFKAALDQEPPVSIRINPLKLKLNDYPERVPWCEWGFYLPRRPVFTLDPLFHAGAYYVQEASSMFLEQVLKTVSNQDDPLLVLDLCGAPGGKTTHLLSIMNRNSFLVTNEVIRSRAQVLVENVVKWGYPNAVVTNNDPRDFAKLGEIFDLVLVDAPCSGEGLFRKDSNAIGEWSADNANLCSARQRRIITDALDCLKPGGYLVYSTCTFNPEENENNLEFLALPAEAKPVEIPVVQFHGIDQISTGTVIGYRFMPHRVRGEGYFTGVLQKQNGKGMHIRSTKKSSFQFPGQVVVKEMEKWLNPDGERIFFTDQNRILAFSSSWITTLEYLVSRLNILSMGLPVAEKAGTVLNPMHNLAVSTDLNPRAFESVELTLQQALQYLKRDTFTAGFNEKGWGLVTYKQLPLGFIKNLGNRFNNYYPAAWRIRMSIPEEKSVWHHLFK